MANVASPAAHVRCRARTWRVLDMQGGEDSTTWQLAQGTQVPRLIASPPDEVTDIPLRRRAVSRRAWERAVLTHARGYAPAWWPASATALPIAALPWQFVPAMMILSGLHRRVLLADEVGMGKTIQAGLLLHEVHAREPQAATLVVTPAGLVPQWVAELRCRVHLEALVLDAASLRREAAQPPAMVDATRPGSCWLMSMDLLRQPDVVSLLARTRWTLLVVDEAHAASPGTARQEAVSRVAGASVRVLLLTATPAAGGSGAADGLRRIGGRTDEKPMAVVRRDVSLLARPKRRSCVLRVDLGADHAALCVRLDAFVERARRERSSDGLLPALVLRRRASSCPAALRRSLERRLDVLGLVPPAMSPVIPGLFESVPALDQDARDDEAMRIPAWVDGDEERQELRRLHELCCRLPPAGRKLRRVTQLALRARQPVIIFTAFLDTLRALRTLLPARSIVSVHGEQPEALRTHALEAFAAGDAAVLLATDTAAEGLNLQARCRLVVHAEVPPSWRILEQRSGRVDRYGQASRVHVVVMSSTTSEDSEALARLQSRGESGEQWLANVTQPRCRRSTVAARHLLRRSPHGQPERRDPDTGDDAMVMRECRLRPRRWRQLARRLALPAGATAIWAATLRAAGGPELSASRMPFVAAGAGTRLPTWPEVAATMPAPLRGQVIRASRLARQLTRWEQETLTGAAVASGPSLPDLFSDARAAAAPVRHACRDAAIWLALDGVAVVSAGTRAR